MKRAIPQKVKPAPSCEIATDAKTGQQKQVPPETNRRARTSAAMIGLAISVGAHSILPTDGAIAAEAASAEQNPAALDVTPASGDITIVPSDAGAGAEAAESSAVVTPNAATHSPLAEANPVSAQKAESSGASDLAGIRASAAQHVVQDGQTLWQIANLYHVELSEIAALNGLSVNTTLAVGQVLKVPAGYVAVQTGQAAVETTPQYYGTVAQVPTEASITVVTPDPNAAAKVEQDAAVDRMDKSRESLRLGLLQLHSAAQQSDQSVVPSGLPNRTEAAEPTVPSVIVQPKVEEPIVAPKVIASKASEETVVSASQVKSAKQDSRKTLVASVISHRVAPGDTLSAIARSYGVSQRQLVQANNLRNPNVIRVDQTLIIPKRPIEQAYVSSESEKANVLPSQLPKSEALQDRSATEPSILSLTPAAEVAKVPFAVPSVNGSDESSDRFRHDYVESLRQEIVKLREQYQGTRIPAEAAPGKGTQVAVTSPISALSVSSPSGAERLNPELGSPRQAPSIVEAGQGGQAAPQTLSPTPVRSASPLRQAQPQKLAVAPIGSESYDPLVSSPTGQMVSPDLPPLGSGDRYLPGNNQARGYIWPARGVLTSGYGWRWGRMHKGIDIAAPIGTPVVAAAEGVVSYAGWNSGGYGYLVEIQHPDGSLTLYAHNNRILVREGQSVSQGEQIAEMGSTGYSTGPHSHFEIHLPGQGAVNPMAYLGRGGA